MVEEGATDHFGLIMEGGASIDYPQFSPPGASFPTQSLPEPLLSLPTMSDSSTLTHKLRDNSLYDEQSSIPPIVAGGVNESTTKSVSVDSLTLRLQHMDNLCQDLQREKNVMEDQFGQQRKKFMNLMVQQDEEQSRSKRSIEQLSGELNQLRQQLKVKDEEIQTCFKDTKMRELAMRESFDIDRLKYEEEITYLRKSRKDHGRQRRASSESGQLIDLQRSPSPGDRNLEGDMAKAVEETRLLKAVVVPLEKEIENLRKQLSEAREKLQHAQQSDTPLLIDLEPPTTDQLCMEHTSRRDLEKNINSLEMEKAGLQDKIVALKSCVVELKTELATKEENYHQLQKTWDMANQHFIVAQDKLQQKMYFLEQKHQLSQLGDIQITQRPKEDGAPSRSMKMMLRKSYSCDSVKGGEGTTQFQKTAIENELKRVKQKLEQQRVTCGSYEAQLQRVQEQMLEELDEKEQELIRLREECNKARAGVAWERTSKEELRRKMEEACEKFKAQVGSYENGLDMEQNKLRSIKEQYTQSKHEAQRDLARFSDERVVLFGQLSSAQEEYDCLKVVQAEETHRAREQIEALTKEQTMAKDNVVALQLRLGDVERERQTMEKDLQQQLAVLQNQLAAAGRERELQELDMRRQLKEAKNQIASLEQAMTELGEGQQMAVAARSDVEEKSRSFIAEQHSKLETEVAARKTAEQTVRELQRQIASLRLQLNTSQENQKDFVELSQTLQMRLAKIEEQQNPSS